MLAATTFDYPTPMMCDGLMEGPLIEAFGSVHKYASFYDPACWGAAMKEIQKQMYNSTSVNVPCLASVLPIKDSFIPGNQACQFNSDFFVAKDIYMYRKLRSENILYRMLFCLDEYINVDPSSVMRLSKGVFISQNWKGTTSSSSPSLCNMDPTKNSFDFSGTVQEAPISTFELNNLVRSISQASADYSSHWQSATGSFVPYSYTFGARFTHMYDDRRDILIRGSLPMWCQALFLSECQKGSPIRPNETRYGLFPFAPNISVTFRSLSTAQGLDTDANPELTMWYERCAMEISEPEMLINEQEPDMYGVTWAVRRRQILDRMLFCDIPDTMASALTSMAAMWVSSQGLLPQV